MLMSCGSCADAVRVARMSCAAKVLWLVVGSAAREISQSSVQLARMVIEIDVLALL